MKCIEVCAIIVTYNRVEKLNKCIRSIINQSEECDIIIVNNACGTVIQKNVILSDFFNNIFFINMNNNTGTAGGFGVGIKRAIELGYKYVWLMDDDVYPSRTALSELMKYAKRYGDRCGCLSSVAYYTDGSLSKSNIQKKGLFSFVKKDEYRNDSIQVKMVSYASMLIPVSVVFDVGLPISEYIIFTDDYEYSYRISKKYQVYVVTSSYVYHDRNENKKTNIVADTTEKEYLYKCLFRNDIHFYSMFGVKGLLYIFFKDAYTFFNILINCKKRKKEKLNTLIQGIKEGIKFNPEIEKI